MLINVGHTYANAIKTSVNSVEDPLEPRGACGMSGYILDAPIPEVMNRKRRRRHRRAAEVDSYRLWPEGKIPYLISNKYSNAGKRLIKKAMQHWQNETCVSFVKRTTEEDYIYIVKGSGCCSFVGRRRGQQALSLGSGCLRFGIITHELGHAVGFWHEQNRPDRSIYVDVIYDNVERQRELNFALKSRKEITTFDQIYDYKSIMHYGSNFFNKNGGDTIRQKPGSTFDMQNYGNVNNNEIGKSYYKLKGPVLSRQDIIETNLLYKCSKLSECGGTLFANSGSFTSPNFPHEYPQNTEKDCIWIITRTKGAKEGKHYTSLSLIFNKFNVGSPVDEQTGLCEDDYVEIREGKGFLSPYIVRYCGNISPAPVTALSGSLYVRFHVSGKNANEAKSGLTGFAASFKTDVCSHRITKFKTKIQTPQFPIGYQPEQDCLWVIEAHRGYKIKVEFLFFSLRELDEQEGCLDYIEIHEGDGSTEKFLGRYCGSNNPGTVISNVKRMKIHFHASKERDLGWYMGFQAEVDVIDIDECKLESHGCSQACKNLPGGYQCDCHSGYRRVYQQSSRAVSCLDKDECSYNNGGCSHNCVNTDGSYTCTCPEGHMLTTNNTCIDVNECAFQRKPCSHICQNTNGGYLCSCRPGYILKSDKRTCLKLPNCEGKFISPVGVITSPLISPSYKHQLQCLWHITVPEHLQLSLNIDLPWLGNFDCNNYLLIHDDERKRKHSIDSHKICLQSDANSDIIMDTNTAVIEYIGKVPFPPQFNIQYHSIAPVKKQCGGEYNVTHGRLHTPGFPYQYPEMQDCVWNIYSPNHKKIKLRFGHFHLEAHEACEYDYVEIEEHFLNMLAVKRIGRFCGDIKPPTLHIDGSTSFITLKFHSDATMSKKGFKVIIKEMD